VGIVGVAVASTPAILSGSIGWSLVSVCASIVVYYAGAITVLALTESPDRGPP
jgi:hypothetical protein